MKGLQILIVALFLFGISQNNGWTKDDRFAKPANAGDLIFVDNPGSSEANLPVRLALYQESENAPDTMTGMKPFFVSDTVEYVPGEVLVKYKPQLTASDVSSLAQRVGIQLVEQIPQIDIQVYRIQTDRTMENVLAALRGETSVAYAEPNYIQHALEIPNDPYFNRLWGLQNEGQTGGTFDADIDAPEAWDREKGKKDIIVSVIDTGIDYNHADISGNIWTNNGEIPNNGVDDDHNGFVDDYHGWDFVNNDADPMDDNEHGTHCSGTIGAVGNNGIGVAGVNWTVSLMAVKFLDSNGSGSTSNAVKGILYAADNGAMIMSNSWGGGGSSQSLIDAITYASNKGALFVAAAGNESNNNDNSPSYPSNYEIDNVVAVAATDDNDQLASFSNYGATTVDMSAPGVSIYSTVPGNNYAYLSGTSMATPHVSGAAALVWAHFLPKSNKKIVKYRLFGGVDYVRNLENKVLLDGRLNVFKALAENPLIAVITKPMDTSNQTGPYQVIASVVDDDTVSNIRLLYRFSGSTTATDSMDMTFSEPYVYSANIPGAATGTTVEYKISATDNAGNLSATRFYSFNVGTGNGGGGGCCGSAAATVKSGNRTGSALATFLLNFLIFFGPPVLYKMRLRRRQ